PNEAAAWLLVKYLALDTQAEVKLATLLGNVPTTFESLKDPAVAADPHFKTFLDIFANPNSGYKQISPLGTTDTTLHIAFLTNYYAGNVPDLQAGPQKLPTDIDKQTQLG